MGRQILLRQFLVGSWWTMVWILVILSLNMLAVINPCAIVLDNLHM